MEIPHTEGPNVSTPGESADVEPNVRESQPHFEAAVELPTEGADAFKSLETAAQDLQPAELGAFGGNNTGETSISTSWQEVSEPPSMENAGEESVGRAEETVVESGIGRSAEERSENSSSSNSDLVHVEKEEIPDADEHSSEGKSQPTPISTLKAEGHNVPSKDDAEIPLEAGDHTQDAKADKPREDVSSFGKSGVEIDDEGKPATPVPGAPSGPILSPASPAAPKDGTSSPSCSICQALMLGGGTLMLLATIALVVRRVRVATRDF